jgi:hypothetical protein
LSGLDGFDGFDRGFGLSVMDCGSRGFLSLLFASSVNGIEMDGIWIWVCKDCFSEGRGGAGMMRFSENGVYYRSYGNLI